jgi:hypothetical protein
VPGGGCSPGAAEEDAVDVDEVWLDAAALRARIAAPAT